MYQLTAEQNSYKNTKEDHFNMEDRLFINNLRVFNTVDTSPKASNSGPPSFYEKDIQNFQMKFSKAIEDRKNFKKVKCQDINLIPLEINENAKEWFNTGKGWTKTEGNGIDTLRKYKSRKSNRNFDNIDFEYKGNAG
jgi:hypothetical protein